MLWAYLDEEHNVIESNDMPAFEERIRRVAFDDVDGIHISTVFLQINHGTESNPLWFETMTFSVDGNEVGCWRSPTWDGAVYQHARAVERVLLAKEELANMRPRFNPTEA